MIERKITIPTKPGTPVAEMNKREEKDFDAVDKILTEIPVLSHDSHLPIAVSADQELGIEVLMLMSAAYVAGRLERK